MQISIEVNEDEAELVRDYLAEVRALAKVLPALESLPSNRARRRVLQYVQDKLQEEDLQRSRP